MVQLYQFTTGELARGSLWLLGSKPTPLKWGLSVGNDQTF